jgi:RHS repeat-associated protein
MQNRAMKAVKTGIYTTFTFYVRDAQGNVLGIYTRTTAATPTITWSEQYLYGSGRLGSVQPGVSWTAASVYAGPHYMTTKRLLSGQKRYEISNHLGNVLTTIGDRKIPVDGAVADNTAEYYTAVVHSAQDYYPFGMEMPGRSFQSGGYRYGFNGKEKDPTEFGSLTHYDYGFRIYNPALGRFLSVDPLKKEYPELTPYQFASNTPIFAIDLDGLEKLVIHAEILEKIGETSIVTSNSDVIAYQLSFQIEYPDGAIENIESSDPFIIFENKSMQEGKRKSNALKLGDTYDLEWASMEAFSDPQIHIIKNGKDHSDKTYIHPLGTSATAKDNENVAYTTGCKGICRESTAVTDKLGTNVYASEEYYYTSEKGVAGIPKSQKSASTNSWKASYKAMADLRSLYDSVKGKLQQEDNFELKIIDNEKDE